MQTALIKQVYRADKHLTQFERDNHVLKMWLEAKVLMLRASLNDFHASGEITLAAKAANLLAYYQGMLELNTRQGLIMARIRRETDEFLAMLASDRVLGST